MGVISLGDRVKDRLSTVEGIVVCRAEYLFGLARLGINTGVFTDDGELARWVYLDELQVELIKKAEFVTTG